jgi:hypothetical protein
MKMSVEIKRLLEKKKTAPAVQMVATDSQHHLTSAATHRIRYNQAT